MKRCKPHFVNHTKRPFWAPFSQVHVAFSPIDGNISLIHNPKIRGEKKKNKRNIYKQLHSTLPNPPRLYILKRLSNK